MKRMFISTVLLLCACAAIASAAQFEGKAIYEISTNGRTMDMTVYVKDQKSRVEVAGTEGMGVKLLMDWGTKKSYMLMDEQQMAMSMPLVMPDAPKSNDESDAVKPEKTGKTKKILGRECEQWIMKSDDNTIEFWNAKGLGNFAGFMGQAPMGLTSGFPDISAVAGLEEFFPMQVTIKNKTGQQIFSMQAKEVVPEQLAESMFSVPSSYHMMENPPQGMRIQGVK